MEALHMNQLADFRTGDTVRIIRTNFANHAEYIGQRGTVRRTVKSRNLVEIELESGRRFRAFPENIVKDG